MGEKVRSAPTGRGGRAAVVALLVGIGTPIAPAAAQTIELAPSGQAYYFYSLAQHDRFEHRYLQAVKHLKRAVELDPESAGLRLELARLYWMIGNRVNGFEQNALEQGEEAARRAPDDLEVHQFLASVYTSLANRDEEPGPSLQRAIEHHEKVLELSMEEEGGDPLALGKLYHQAGRFREAADLLGRFVEEEQDSLEGLFWLSMAYQGAGMMTDAVAPLRRALEMSPRSFQLREAMADLQERRGNWEAAIQEATMLLRLAPDRLEEYDRLARLYRRAGEPERALEVYHEAEQVARRKEGEGPQARLAEFHLSRVETLMEAERAADALELLPALAAQHPGDPRFPLALGQLQYRTGKRDDGLRTLEEVLESYPEDTRVARAVSNSFLSLGAQAEQGGDLEESERLLERSIAVNPENDTALNYLGYLWADAGRNLDQSIRYIERALKIGGDNGAYLDSLGWAYFRKQRFDLAEEHLERAAQLSADEPEIREHLGDLYRATARPGKAIDEWRRAIDLGAENREDLERKIQEALEAGNAQP